MLAWREDVTVNRAVREGGIVKTTSEQEAQWLRNCHECLEEENLGQGVRPVQRS